MELDRGRGWYNDMKPRSRFAGDAAIYTISNFAVAGVPFLLLPILTRVLSPDDYGMVAMFTVMVSLFVVFAGLNTHGAVMVRYFEPEKFSMQRYVPTTLSILFVTTILLAFLVSFFSEQLTAVTSLKLEWLMLAVAVAALQFLVQTLLTLWQASKQPSKYGALRFSHALMDGTLSIFFVVVMLYVWQGRLFGITVAWSVTAILSIYWLRREGWLTPQIDVAYAKDALRYGVPLVPHALGGLVLGMADRFFVTNLLDVGSTGIYVVAAQLGLILGILADSFNKAFAPWLMEKLGNINLDTQKRIVIFTYGYFVAILLFAVLGGIATPYVLPLIVGPQYQTAEPIVIYLLLGNAFIGMYYMVTNYIFFSGKTGLLSTLTVSVGGLTLILSWFLIENYGIAGAAIGFMLGQAFLFLGAWALSNYCVPMPWFKVFIPSGAV